MVAQTVKSNVIGVLGDRIGFGLFWFRHDGKPQ